MFQFRVWFLPLLILGVTTALAVPLSRYCAWIMNGKYRAPAFLRWLEGRCDTGPQNWKQYAVAMMLFNLLMFVFGFTVLSCQPLLPLNPDGKTMVAPTTIFNSVASFLTNTNLQHYSGEQHLSYFSQIFFVCWNMFLSASVGFCALSAIIRGLRGDAHMGNFYVDMWRVVVYMFLPASLVMGVVLLADGVPMTLEATANVATLEPESMGKSDQGQANPQPIARGPVAAIIPIKHLGTNGGGFFGANSAHPFENPSAWSNILTVMNLCLFPFTLVLMFGRMLKQMRHAWVIFGVMMSMLIVMIVWAVGWDTLQPNPALEAHADMIYPQEFPQADGNPQKVWVVARSGSAAEFVDARSGQERGRQAPGRLHSRAARRSEAGQPGGQGIALRHVGRGDLRRRHDRHRLRVGQLRARQPQSARRARALTGMWLNCIFGGKGVGMVNLLIYLIVGVFIAGLMVGRTPEYLGKKVEAREMKLAMLALLVHPILILMSTGYFAATNWGLKAMNNPGAHGFSEVLYEFSSASANNGSEFGGLNTAWGSYDPNSPDPPVPQNPPFDIATGLVMLLGRFLPVIAPMAMAASLSVKKPTPFTVGTMRTDTFTFACVLLGTIILVGALLFLPVAALGPIAEHFGPLPFGG